MFGPASPSHPVQFEPGLLDAVMQRLREARTSWTDQATRADFERAVDAAYRLPNPADRRMALDRESAAVVGRTGLPALVAALVSSYPTLHQRIDRIVLGLAPMDDQRVDVCGPDAQQRWTLVARLELDVWLDPAELDRFMRHEIEHAVDALDPHFMGGKGPAAFGAGPGSRQVVQQRLAALWCCAIDSRLERAGHRPVARRDEYLDKLQRLYPAVTAGECDDLVEQLSSPRRWTHETLLGLASASADDVQSPGNGTGHCPLCKFRSTDWTPASEGATATLELVVRDFPGWTPTDGWCSRCHEGYAARTTDVSPQVSHL